jgi:hypothetical protein
MATNIKTPVKQDTKVKISALWLFAMLTYTYGDVVTLMDPVKHGSIQLTEGFLLGGSIFMMIPITMVLLSRISRYKAIRWSSIVASPRQSQLICDTIRFAILNLDVVPAHQRIGIGLF